MTPRHTHQHLIGASQWGPHLGVHVRVDPQQHLHHLPRGPGSRSDVLEVKLAVDVHEDPILGSQLQLVGLLAVAVEDAAGEKTLNRKR